MKYVVISPVRDEAEHLRLTIRSMVSQQIRPQQWILVNDGSKDETPQLIEDAARTYDWIRAVHRPDRSFRQAGSGVMEAFYEGYQRLASEDWEFLAKLDGDLSFDRDFFQKCFERFQSDPRLGICGGLICRRIQGALEEESKMDPIFHVRGATKIYRAACWKAINGLTKAPGWDTLDEVKANMLGWKTRTFHDLKVLHHRPTGAAYGIWHDWVKAGLANYIVGYHPLFMLFKCVRRTAEKPYGIAALALLWGYVRGYLQRTPQIDDRDVIQYFRRQQLNRIMGRRSLWSESSAEGA
jgi:glycosyltransferase involved in cell wall biosynthesis